MAAAASGGDKPAGYGGDLLNYRIMEVAAEGP